MVMKRNAMRTNLRQSIVKSFGRYIAIVLIIALGSGIFVGLLMSKTDMVATGQAYMDAQNMFDLRLICNYGWTEKYVEEFSKFDGIEDAEGMLSFDFIARLSDTENDSVYRFHSISEKVNQNALRAGRMPTNKNECLADGYLCDNSIIGKKIIISPENDEDSLDSLLCREFTIVGLTSSPLYMDMNRGTTAIGSGSIENYFFVLEDAFDTDYYTEIHVTLAESFPVYSDEYNSFLDMYIEQIEPEAEKLAGQRFRDVKKEAEDEYAEGYQEYLDGVKEYEEGKLEAEQELADALQELQDAEKELEDNRRKLIKAGDDIEAGEEAIAAGREELKRQADLCRSSLETINSQIPQVEGILGQFGDPASLAAAVESAKSVVSAAQSALENAQTDEEREQFQGELETALSLKNQAEAAYGSYSKTAAGLQALKDNKATLEAALIRIPQEQHNLEVQGAKLKTAYDTLMSNWTKFHEGEKELEEAWVEYEDAKIEVAEELAEAVEELNDAKQELADARQEIDDLEEADLIILERSSNVGYNNLDSSSDIVAGVSKVIPVFFLLVASLVCITTMTRMIDEERTQIGTLKALGYSNWAIIGKYMAYSGSGALLGCAIGIFAGCTIFPMIIWEAYKIMLYIQPNIVLTIDWSLSLTVMAVYTAVMLFVTWYCCRRTLTEEPAELIRPKAPDAGKKILLERLPFWHKISFLNKVMVRNIFRYRQRLAMMLVGIGGCTALLVTGFGLRDSLINIVDFQFRDITKFDLEVYFQDEITPQVQGMFLDIVDDSEYLLFHQSSVELEYGDVVKEIYMVSSFRDTDNFIDMHYDGVQVRLPGENEIVLSVGMAEMLDLDVGDQVLIRNSDMESMALTVSGIYENHVYNYCFVSPETIRLHWGALPERQMAFVKLNEGVDPYSISAELTDMKGVMNVTVSKDVANMVGSMMEALDLVIILIVFCAGLLSVTVLYNLTNININERIREIATIKVLGFRAGETAAYVFKENMTLTVVGSFFGLALGKLLLDFVMTQIKIDMVWFKTMISNESYWIAIALTLLSAIMVNFVFYFKLQKINMAEALKSVE